jgi:hypothetical protein
MVVHHDPRSQRIRRQLAASDGDEDEDDDDDDEEEEEEENEQQNGPLKDGVDSVSWLPSVIGAKGDDVALTSAKEVRDWKDAKKIERGWTQTMFFSFSPLDSCIPR